MISKEHIENFLKINDIPADAPDTEIKSALVRARWHERDVELALVVLRGSGEQTEVSIGDSERVLIGEHSIAPETISSLLGIDINLYRKSLLDTDRERRNVHFSNVFLFTITITAALLFAFMSALGLMYIMSIGPFYNPVEQFAF